MGQRNPHVEPAIRAKGGPHDDTRTRAEVERDAVGEGLVELDVRDDYVMVTSDGWLTFDDFVKGAIARFRRGREEYGDGSYARPRTELVAEIEQEAADLVGWPFILWHTYSGLDDDYEAHFRSFLSIIWHKSHFPPPERMSGKDYALWCAAMGLQVLRQSRRLRVQGEPQER